MSNSKIRIWGILSRVAVITLDDGMDAGLQLNKSSTTVNIYNPDQGLC